MLPTLQTMLDAAASEAVVEPHDVAADGDMGTWASGAQGTYAGRNCAP